uniref:Uncharacterized protein n=1 Tax=Tanacetum cinerariifolium TaxID=118510 RepID=A0A6L2J684_TANCI|nr:hypothetical protein [Tanacetum cinerariifolium]
MSDSEHSTVTYTSISSDYEEPSDISSPGVVVYGYDRLPMHPPSPDYVLGPEHPPLLVYVPYVSEPTYPEFMPPEDDVFLAEEQPMPATASLTANSPGYILESDPKEDPEEEDDEDPEEDPADYPADRDDDEEENSSGDDAGIQLSGTLPSGTPPLLPISLPTSSPPLLLPSTDCRADVPEVTLPPQKRLCIALGPRFEVVECSSAPTATPTKGFREDYGFVGTLDAEIRRDPDREICYGITDVWEDTYEILEEIPATDVSELGQRMTYFVTGRLDDALDDRLLMSSQLNLLRRDRRSHARTARPMESEAKASREACVETRREVE